MSHIPSVKSFVTLERQADGVSRVKFRVRYDTAEGMRWLQRAGLLLAAAGVVLLTT